MEKKLLERFMKYNWEKLNKKSLELKNLNEEKGDSFYVKWKGYIKLINNWIDEKDIVI